MDEEAAVSRRDAIRVVKDQAGRDEKLSALLQAWKGCEPGSDFDEKVWRRIRATTDRAERMTGVDWLLAWLRPCPAWAGAIAASAAVVIGVVAGVATREQPAGRHDAEALLHGLTLAGSYLETVSGGSP